MARNRNRNKNKSPRPGSVKANRAAGTNKSAQKAKAKAQARKSSSGGAQRASTSAGASSSAAARSGGSNKQNNSGGGNRDQQNNIRLRELRQKVKEREADGKGTDRLQGKIDRRRDIRKANAQKSHNSQNIQNVTDFDFEKRSKKIEKGEMSHLRKQGYGRQEIIDHMEASNTDLRKGAQRKLDKWKLKLGGGNPTDPTDPTNPTDPTDPTNPTNPTNPTDPTDPSPTTNPGGGTGGGGGNTDVDVTTTQVQTVNQDNDQTSTITGNNNTVTQDQDNSIDQLGGNNSTTVNGGTAGSGEQAQSLFNAYVDSLGSVDVDIDNTQSQDVTQDNDQTSTITGDNNKVWQTQDNSIRQYGGDNRSFIYNGSGGYMDTPVSAATMGGFYDVDDSPAAQAKFNDLHTTLNRDNQKRFAGMGMKTAGMFEGFNAASFDPAVLQTRIDQSTLRSFDQATVKDNDIFGDRDLYRGLLSGYNFGKPPKAADYDDDDD